MKEVAHEIDKPDCQTPEAAGIPPFRPAADWSELAILFASLL